MHNARRGCGESSVERDLLAAAQAAGFDLVIDFGP
jgi:hypothetical protein